MSRVRLIEEPDGMSPPQAEVFDYIIASRGKMLRPFQVLVHRPDLARAVADLGTVIRFQGILSDHVRELAIFTTAIERDCEYEWSAHLPLAREAGVSEETLEAVQHGTDPAEAPDAAIVEFARELCRSGVVSDSTFSQVRERYGEEGAVELVAAVGYYTMMAFVMSAFEAC